MFVRTASERDVPAVRDLLVETWHATYDAIYGIERVNEITARWHSVEALNARLEEPRSEFLVADDGVTIAGMAFATTAEKGLTVMLRQLYVRHAFQGRGVGGLLLDEMEGSFHDAERVRVEVEKANPKAVAFYLAQGFAEVGRGDDHDDSRGTGTLIYERPILWAD